MKSNIMIAMAAGFALAVSAAFAANMTFNPQVMQQHDTNTLQEQVNVLSGQVKQLSSQVDSLKSQLAQATKTANDAFFKAGLAQIWVNGYGDKAAKAGDWVNGSGDKAAKAGDWVSANGSSIMQVVAAYPKHTHGYQTKSLGYTNVHCDPGQGGYCAYINKWVDVPATTAAPN